MVSVAFIVAGAETVITSLWKVHDQATGELMTLFYQRLLDPKSPKVVAKRCSRR